eukprot:Awhi_evm1s9236
MLTFFNILYFHVLISQVQSHGMLTLPVSRNVIAALYGQDTCPHCQAGGGIPAVQSNSPGGNYVYPETKEFSQRAGFCGNSANSNKVYDKAGPIVNTYKAGSVIDIQLSITAHHRGIMEFRLCDQSEITYECLSKHKLIRVKDSSHDRSPIDEQNPSRYYLEPGCAGDSPHNFDENNFATLAPPGQRITMKYKLPDGVTCDHCVLQWWWVTGNSCNIKGATDFKEPNVCNTDKIVDTFVKSVLGNCGNGRFPEEFWNCADIAITSDGKTPEDADEFSAKLKEISFAPQITSGTSRDPTPFQEGSICISISQASNKWCRQVSCHGDYLGRACDWCFGEDCPYLDPDDPHPTSSRLTSLETAPGASCISIHEKATHSWCKQVNCRGDYLGTFCAWCIDDDCEVKDAPVTTTYVDPASTFVEGILFGKKCVSTSPKSSDLWCTQVLCAPDYISNGFCALVDDTSAPSSSDIAGKVCVGAASSDAWCKQVNCIHIHVKGGFCKWVDSEKYVSSLTKSTKTMSSTQYSTSSTKTTSTKSTSTKSTSTKTTSTKTTFTKTTSPKATSTTSTTKRVCLGDQASDTWCQQVGCAETYITGRFCKWGYITSSSSVSTKASSSTTKKASTTTKSASSTNKTSSTTKTASSTTKNTSSTTSTSKPSTTGAKKCAGDMASDRWCKDVKCAKTYITGKFCKWVYETTSPSKSIQTTTTSKSRTIASPSKSIQTTTTTKSRTTASPSKSNQTTTTTKSRTTTKSKSTQTTTQSQTTEKSESTPTSTSNSGKSCGSINKSIPDSWCRQVACADVYSS